MCDASLSEAGVCGGASRPGPAEAALRAGLEIDSDAAGLRAALDRLISVVIQMSLVADQNLTSSTGRTCRILRSTVSDPLRSAASDPPFPVFQHNTLILCPTGGWQPEAGAGLGQIGRAAAAAAAGRHRRGHEALQLQPVERYIGTAAVLSRTIARLQHVTSPMIPTVGAATCRHNSERSMTASSSSCTPRRGRCQRW